MEAFSVGRSPHKDWLATFVDDVRGGVLETETAKQAGREEVQWCPWHGRLGARPSQGDAEGAKAVSQRWVDTD